MPPPLSAIGPHLLCGPLLTRVAVISISAAMLFWVVDSSDPVESCIKCRPMYKLVYTANSMQIYRPTPHRHEISLPITRVTWLIRLNASPPQISDRSIVSRYNLSVPAHGRIETELETVICIYYRIRPSEPCSTAMRAVAKKILYGIRTSAASEEVGDESETPVPRHTPVTPQSTNGRLAGTLAGDWITRATV